VGAAGGFECSSFAILEDDVGVGPLVKESDPGLGGHLVVTVVVGLRGLEQIIVNRVGVVGLDRDA